MPNAGSRLMLPPPPARNKCVGAASSPIHAHKQFARLETEPEYDLLVVGGGATGSGVALDAVTRGTIE